MDSDGDNDISDEEITVDLEIDIMEQKNKRSMAFVKRPVFHDIYSGAVPGKLGQALQMVTLGFGG